MAKVDIPDDLISELHKAATPFEPLESVLRRLIEGFQNSKPSPASPESNDIGVEKTDFQKLSFSKPTEVQIEGHEFGQRRLNWNSLLDDVVKLGCDKLGEEKVFQLLPVNAAMGIKNDDGYHLIEGTGLSVQGQSADRAWRAALTILEALGLSGHVRFRWNHNPKSPHPGQTGYINF